jgi:hypothetical protein
MCPVHKTLMEVEVAVHYDMLPPEEGLPQQVDITEAIVETINHVTGKTRKVNILNAFSQAEIINLEDEILGAL